MKPTMPRQSQHAQQGVVLIVVLIMLVVIGLSSAAVMRNALEADLISANVRSEHLATEAAQAALAFCETQVITTAITPRAISEAADKKQHWEDLAKWLAAPTATEGPFTPPNWDAEDTSAGKSGSAQAIGASSNPPQCMAEYIAMAGATTTSIVRITARGFTPDYTVDASTQQPASGSAVWVQSTLQLAE